MPATHPSSLPARSSRSGGDERGFGLVEILVVLLLIAVLMALAITTLRGTKRNTHYKTAQAAATSYAEAIEAYMADNGRVAPKMGDPGWPADTRPQRIAGPVDAMLRGPNGGPKPYMSRPAPESVATGLVDVVNGAAAPDPNAQAVVRYGVNGGTYTLRVEMVVPNETTPPCVVTNAPTPPSGVNLCGG